MTSIKGTREINIVTSITRSPHLGPELIPSGRVFLEANHMSAYVILFVCINLLNIAFSARAAIETTNEKAIIFGPSGIVNQVKFLGNLATLALIIAIGTQLTVPGSRLAGQSKRAEDREDLHID
jgi:hypothetical protein